jgi:hypothetical protein
MALDAATLNQSVGPGTAANTKGFGNPAHIALMEEQTKAARQKFDMDKENHRIAGVDKWYQVVTQGLKLKGPAAKVMLDYANKLAPMIGMPGITAESWTTLKDPQINEQAWTALAGVMNGDPGARANPENLKLVAEIINDPTKHGDFFQHISTNWASRDNAKTMANGQQVRQLEGDMNRRMMNEQDNLTKAGLEGLNLDSLSGKNGPEAQKAELEFARKKREAAAASSNAGAGLKTEQTKVVAPLAGATVEDKKAGAELKKAQAGVVKQNADANTLRAKSAAEKARQTNNNSGARLQLQQERLNNTVLGKIQADLKPIQTTAFQADKALALLNKPSITWGEAKEILIDYTKALSGAGNNAIAREQGLADGYFTLGDKVRQLYGKYVANNPESSTINADTLKLLKEDVQNLATTVKAQYETVVRTNLELRRGTGLHPSVIEQAYRTYGVKPVAPGMPSNDLSPGEKATAPKASTGAAPTATGASKGPIPGAMLQDLQNTFKTNPAGLQRALKHLESKGYVLPTPGGK